MQHIGRYGIKFFIRYFFQKTINISYRDSHQLRAPVASTLGLVDVIIHDHMIHSEHIEIVNHLKETVAKLDNIIREVHKILDDFQN